MSVTTVDGREFNMSNHVGQALAIIGKEFRPEIKTIHGDRPAYKADIVVLDGDDEGTYYEDVLVFATTLIDRLKQEDADTLVGCLERQATGHSSGSTKYVLTEPTALELRLAAKYGA